MPDVKIRFYSLGGLKSECSGYNFTGILIKSIKNKDMRTLSILVLVGMLAQTSINAHGQTEQKVYIGAGMGLDYGGIIGGKVEYLPIKHLGLFGGVGYNTLSLGWNAGASLKFTPEKRSSAHLMAFYGYNGVLKVSNTWKYEDMVSYGVTFGLGWDVKLGRGARNKFSFGLFVPIRSKEFMDTWNAIKKDKDMKVEQKLMPIAISFGFNFGL